MNVNETSRLVSENGRSGAPSGTHMSMDLEQGSLDGSVTDGQSSSWIQSCCGECVKSLVFGGYDGIISSLAIVCGCAGANLSWKVVVVLGVASTISNSFSTGLSEFLSSKAHREFIQAEKRREMWEFKHYKDHEITEMVNRFESRGMARRDAEQVVGRMAQYEGFFVGLMVSEELGLQLPEDDDALLITDAFVMFISFAAFGAIPVLLYCLGPLQLMSEKNLFLVAASVSLAVLVVLGIVKSTFSASNWLLSAMETLFVGVACSAIAYFVGQQLMVLVA